MRIILTFIFCLVSLNAFAGQWYIVNKDDKSVVATASIMPDQKDLDDRGQIAVFSEDKISLDQADYKGKKIVVHEKTAKELEKESAEKIEAEKEAKIQAKMRELAEKALAEEGK